MATIRTRNKKKWGQSEQRTFRNRGRDDAAQKKELSKLGEG
jgi:hypothetical protein